MEIKHITENYNFKIFIVLLLLLLSCQNSENTKISKLASLNFVLGKWQNVTAGGTFREYWEKKNDSLFSGRGFMFRGLDTLFSEDILISASGNDIYYIARASGQNNELPASFKLISDSAGILIFENPFHDFPQRIIYSNPKPGSLHASIEGTVNGKFRRQDFPMTRIPSSK